MSLARLANLCGKSLAVAAVVLTVCPTVFADGCLKCREKCPPPYVHCQEGPPRIKFKCGCPKPVCCPCNLEHYGYYQTCWRPWSFPPDWSHCPVPPPGVVIESAPVAPVLPPVDAHPMPGANQKH